MKTLFKLAIFPVSLLRLALPLAMVSSSALAAYVAEPDAAHSAASRRHTGIPSVAVARNGRMWITFYGSPTGGEDSNNYCTLATSEDGGLTWTDVLVADPDGLGPKRAFDPEVWTTPDGRVFWTWAERVAPLQAETNDPGAGCNADPRNDKLMCVEFPGDEPLKPPYPQPRQIARGVMMCKPIVRSDGAWLFPSAHWSDAPSACVYESRDAGKSFAFLGGVTLPQRVRVFDEHVLAELGNGDILTFIRTARGTNCMESVSHDGGRTWEVARKARFEHTSSRFFLRRLKSGNLLLVKHGKIDEDCGRRKLTAYLSDDDGATWKGGLLLDERHHASYPDGDQAADGLIHVVYDHDRTGAQEILLASFTEADVLAGKDVSGRMRLRGVVSAFAARPARNRAVKSFSKAKPVWIEGEERATNSFCAIRCRFDGDSGAATLRVTAAYDYRVRLNGRFVGFGPVRAPEGLFRIDEWKLAGKRGGNVVEIEAAGYNCNSYYFINQPSFVQAEVLVGGNVVAATGVGNGFESFDAGRICKAPRFSGQRTFIDAWRVGGMVGPPQKLAVQPMRKYEARPLPYPDFAVNRSFRPIRKERLVKDPSRKILRPNFIESKIDTLHTRFPVNELETNPYYDLQGFARALVDGDARSLSSGESATFEGDRNVSGFIGLKVRTYGPCRIVLSWDEILGKDGTMNISRLGCAAVAEWRIASAGEYELETFEPYAAKYIDVAVLEGKASVNSVWVRTYVSPLADRASFRASDPALERIFLAARESYRANAVDGFTDCPTRERAYWTGDTFFTARASAWLTGDGAVEKTFLSNFLLADRFDWSGYNSKGVDMNGAIPALYPGSIFWDNFISTYMMWTVMQLEEHIARYGDREFADKCRPAVLGIARFLSKFKNSDGLLEKLPGWVFVEWSKANELVQDVNYPANMMYARMLEACAKLYQLPELAEEARAVRAEIVRQSWNGEWFCDNAVRQKDGSLKLSGECTETCQYCAFFFGTVTPESHPALWKRMLDEFGPDRVAKGVHKRIWPANFIFGTCERLDLLSRDGRSRQILEETRDWFLTMADRTGTLWEHLNTKGNCSCCHGFAAIASEYLFRDVLGVREIDRQAKTIRISPAVNMPLEWCEGTLPLSRDEVAVVKWRMDGDGLNVDVKLPEGWSRK